MRLGVDTGGTFTDFVWLAGNGRWRINKQLSTPDDPSAAVLAGVVALGVGQGTAVIHGSTVATNALLERRGARTALITTAGFSDVLAIGRQHRPDLYALVPQKPAPLVPAAWRFGVRERVTAQGDVLLPLDEESVTAVLETIAANNIEAVAVCLLFSFLHPDHEQQIKQRLSALPNAIHVSLSSEILPEYREYERTATTVINAYVAPLMGRYLNRLAAKLAPRHLSVMQSSGGIISAAAAGEQAARTALSGPAGGVVGARFVGDQAGFNHIITFDMGGTSTDVALCPGRLPTTSEGEIADMPLRLPIIDIHTVGAGGGSLAAIDAGGALHVGPQSAGAEPGPVCYGRATSGVRDHLHERVTVTDANLVLGRLDAVHFLGGVMRLDEAVARAALRALAQVMGAASPEEAAWGVIQVANANMERAIRRISVERGHDPRRFTLVAFGGAGPLHACDLAENLQIPRVLIANAPGVLSALGMLAAAPTRDYSQTVMARPGDWGVGVGEWLAAQFAPLAERALAEMMAEGFDKPTPVGPTAVTLQRSLDMRYVGQSHELTVVWPEAAADPAALFHAVHEARYGYRQAGAAVEIVTIRLTAVAAISPPQLPTTPPGDPDPTAAHWGKDGLVRWPTTANSLYDQDKLRSGPNSAVRPLSSNTTPPQ
ncbi:MAG: hydantoinase/oxoprolinase family protein [Chloroflexi bacterium]|nr:hydantoinase/oxoprolinase family protein [Chloroflexota bacterium]